MNTAKTHVAAATTALLLALPASADEEHFDVWLQIGDDGNLTTGSITEDLDPIDESWRVFGAEFGEAGVPFFADEPGFQALDGTFDPFYTFRINIDGPVQVWNGAGFADTPERMSLGFGPSNVTSGDGPVEGFTFDAESLGGFHDHFDLTIDGPGVDPGDGVYLLPLSIADESGGFGATETFWFVMNLNMDEAAHDAAIDYVQENFVPAPGALAVLLAGGLVGRRRRRHG